MLRRLVHIALFLAVGIAAEARAYTQFLLSPTPQELAAPIEVLHFFWSRPQTGYNYQCIVAIPGDPQ